MQFGPVPVSSAKGAILAHSLRVGDHTFKKGRVLSEADLDALASSGYRTLTVARLEAGDVAEDRAAERITSALAGEAIRVAAAFTGRANLYAEASGALRIDADRIAALNAIDESITVATLPPFAPVSPRQMVATVKIIPFAVRSQSVEAAEELLRRSPALTVASFRTKRVALISTVLPDMKQSLLAKNRAALDARVEPLGSSIVHESRIAHDTADLAKALREACDLACDPILVFGASAITDRRDVIPAAIVEAGGLIEHFGMPVDPGNLLLLGRIGRATIVGLPGCARSPKLNGFDFVLQRLLGDIPVGAGDIAAMGVGGLLTEIRSRPQPRDLLPHTARAPSIAAVILAAGLSTRMGRNKLMEDLDGKPLLRRVAEAALGSVASPVIVVTGSKAETVRRALSGLSVSIVENLDFKKGLSSSLIRGINAVPDDRDGAIVLLGDMPDIPSPLIDKLIAAFDPEDSRAICVATYEGQRGNPVLWSRQFFAEIATLDGDKGAKSLMAAHPDLVCEVEADDEGPLVDIDTPEALDAYRSRIG